MDKNPAPDKYHFISSVPFIILRLEFTVEIKNSCHLPLSVVDFLLAEKMKDGGFNSLSNTTGATHSSLHSTLSAIEEIFEYQKNKYEYRLTELEEAKNSSQEFILTHKLFRSDKSGEIISPGLLKLCYPSRWYYDILRAMDYFQFVRVAYDSRMDERLEVLIKKRTKKGLWKLASKHPLIHFKVI